ncbi:hypothetical protein GHT06_017133 [Daphnia sinensis]|uniref:Uncharacterized protein n=1 Tax=Daphnia sinensis TaxID=1820382 RepID=A0AAD5L6X8_9CRUS|nr:hypothetical protein GHT06_017133 [Daphnia sinensis]
MKEVFMKREIFVIRPRQERSSTEEIKERKQPPKKRRREDDNESDNLLDMDSDRMECDANAGPSTSAAATGATDPASTSISASSSDNTGRTGPSTGDVGATG